MTPRIAIIIVTHNGGRFIKNCLASIFTNDYEGQFDVVVADNNSTDDTVALIKNNFPQVELIELPRNLGFAGGNNVGIRKALRFESPPWQVPVPYPETSSGQALIREGARGGYDYIVLLNQDTEAAEDWLAELVKVAQEKEAGIIQSMLLLPPPPTPSRRHPKSAIGGFGDPGAGGDINEHSLTNNVGNAMHYLGFGFVKHYREEAGQWLGREPFAIGYASGAAMLIKREVLEKVALQPSPLPSPPYQVRGRLLKGEGISYFNPLFFAYHEDLDLCWRARLVGYKIIIAPQAIVYHYYEFSRNKNKFYLTERNRWACLLQNYSGRTLLLLAPMLIVVELMMLAYSLFTGWLWEKFKSYIWFMVHLPSIVARRRQVQSRRVVSDREILRAMDAKLQFSEVDNFILRHVVNPLAVWYYKKVGKLIG